VELCRSLLAEGPTGLLAAYAWNTLASAFVELGRFGDAIEASRSAVNVGGLGRSSLNWLCAAIQLGNVPEFSEASSIVRDQVEESVIEEYAFAIAADRKLGIWKATDAAIKLRSDPRFRVPTDVEKLINAFR
jgi:hypothetical protein